MDILYSNEVNQYLTPAELTVLLQTNRAVIKQSYGGIHAPTARFFKFYRDGEIRKHHNIKVTAMPKIRENKSFMIQGSNPTNNCTLHYRFVHFEQLIDRNHNIYPFLYTFSLWSDPILVPVSVSLVVIMATSPSVLKHFLPTGLPKPSRFAQLLLLLLRNNSRIKSMRI